jgi:hypothetical protein
MQNTGVDETKNDYNSAKTIMKLSISNLDELISFWNFGTVYQEILREMEWSKPIWLEVINNGAYHIDFPPLGEVLVYLYENKEIDEDTVLEFISSKKFFVPKIILENIKFSKEQLYKFLSFFIDSGNYPLVSFLFEKDLLPDLGGEYPNEDNYDILSKIVEDDRLGFLSSIIKKGYPVKVYDLERIILSRDRNISKKALIGTIRIMMDNGINLENLQLPLLLGRDNILAQILPLLGHVLDPTRTFPHRLKGPILSVFPASDKDEYYAGLTLLDVICCEGHLAELNTLITFGLDINDPSLSTLQLIKVLRASRTKDSEEMVGILLIAGYNKRGKE